MTSSTRCQVLVLQVFLLFASVTVAEVLAETEALQTPKQETVHPHNHSHHHHPHHHHHHHRHSGKHHSHASVTVAEVLAETEALQTPKQDIVHPHHHSHHPHHHHHPHHYHHRHHHSGKHHSHEEWSLHEKENKTARGRTSSHWRFQNVVKEIVNRSDVKTVILAKDSTFNFFPSNYHAHVDVHKKIRPKTVVDSKNDDVVSMLPHVTPPGVFIATAIEQNVEDSTTQQNGDVTEAPPTPGGFHPLDVEITSSSRDTETVTGGNAGDAHTPEGGETTSSRDVEVTSSVVDATGSETVTEGNAGEGNIGVVASTIEPIEPKNDEVLVTEEVLSGRVNENSYVFIKSMLPVKNQGPDVSLVLDIDFEDTKAEDGSRRIVLSTNDQALSEQWFIDNQTNTIRNRQKNLCISYSDSHQLIASPCNVTSKRQMWLYDHNRRALHNPFYDFVAEVGKFGDPEAAVGDHVQVMAYDGSPTQHFELGTLPFFFVLVNEETGLALSVFEDRDRPGTKLVLALLQSPPSKGQLWYFDSREVLRSKINDNVIDSSSDTFRSEPFSYEAVDTTSWTFFDRQIINLKDERQVMEPVSTPDDEKLILAPRRHHDEKIGQKFKIVYPNAAKRDAAAPEIITATSPGPLSEISSAV